jgi:hypothetical protein
MYEIYPAERVKLNKARVEPTKRSPGRPKKNVSFNIPPQSIVQPTGPETIVEFEEDPYESAPEIEMQDAPPVTILPREPMTVSVTTKNKRTPVKRLPSQLDQVPSYNIVDDLPNLKVTMPLPQILKFPEQQKNLNNYMKRQVVKQVNNIEKVMEPLTSAAKCYIRIKRNPVAAVLDSGAAVSIITNDLRKRLGLKITRPSKTVITIANGTHQRALGEVENVGIAVQNLLIPMTVTVIESMEENLLLGTDFLHKTNALLNFQDGIVSLKYKGKETSAEILFIQGYLPVDVEETNDDEIEFNQTDDEENFEETPEEEDDNNELDALEEYEDEEDYEEPTVTINNSCILEPDSDSSSNDDDSDSSERPQQDDKLPSYNSENNDNNDNDSTYSPAVYLTDIQIDTNNSQPLTDILDEEQTQQMDKLFTKNNDIFAENISEEGQTMELTQTHIIEHEIDTGVEKPVAQKPYRLAYSEQEFVKQEIEAMLDKGIIRPSKSPWSSPIVLVPKKNNKKRICIDYRKLNQITEKDVYPLPNIDEILDSFNGAQWFSTLDMASGYWQVSVKEEDRPKTAFITKFGLFEFNVMPFGLCNAPATFQRLMNQVMSRYIGKFIVVYLDDITIYSKTFDDHIKHLKTIFETLRQAKLKLNKDKCHFFLPSIKFLGHVITRNGILPDEDKLIKVKNFPIPNNLRTLRGFLGLASYYRKFIQKFSDIAKPLNQLLQKGEKFNWTQLQQKAFEKLKHYLITAPILQHPDFDKPFYLHTDASGIGLGAVLAQKDDDNKREYAIAYASRSLTKAEKNYSATELECLAVVWAVEHFHQYFGTNHFFVVTDHAALKWLKTTELKGRRARWIIRLESYNYTILHRAGRKHNNADVLSRLEN